MSRQTKLVKDDFNYNSLPPYMKKEFVERRAKKEAIKTFKDNGNYLLYGCKYDEYFVPSYYTKDGKYVMGYCRKFSKKQKKR